MRRDEGGHERSHEGGDGGHGPQGAADLQDQPHDAVHPGIRFPGGRAVRRQDRGGDEDNRALQSGRFGEHEDRAERLHWRQSAGHVPRGSRHRGRRHDRRQRVAAVEQPRPIRQGSPHLQACEGVQRGVDRRRRADNAGGQGRKVRSRRSRVRRHEGRGGLPGGGREPGQADQDAGQGKIRRTR